MRRLRVWAPQGSEVQFVRQVAPMVEDLTPKRCKFHHWSASSRTGRGATRVATTTLPCVSPAPMGNERLAARVEVVVNDQVVAKSLVKATWSADANLTTRIDPAVAHYTGQAQLADAIQQGLPQRPRATIAPRPRCWARRPRSPTTSGNEDTTRLLSQVVDVVDAEAGTVRLKSNIERTDEMALDTRSTKTTRIRRGPVTTYTCPNGHQSGDPEWCDTCGAPSVGVRHPACCHTARCPTVDADGACGCSGPSSAASAAHHPRPE